MDNIHIDVTGVRQVGLRFEEFPDLLYDEMKAEIEALSTELLLRIEAATPSDTGLLRSQERLRIFADKDSIKGYVDVAGDKSKDFAKAGALEYSAHRSGSVKAHKMRLDHLWAEKLNNPITVMVDAFPRTPNIQEFAFERGPLAAMEPEIIARLTAVVDKTVAETNA